MNRLFRYLSLCPVLLGLSDVAYAIGGAESCATEGSSKSISGDQKVTVTFKNGQGAPLRLYWLDYEGKRKFYASLQPDKSLVQETFVTHPWVATDDNEKCIQLMTATKTEDYLLHE